MGDYARADLMHREALEIRKRTLGVEHPEYASDLNNLALLYHNMGDYARAESMHREALTIRKRTLGVEHPEYAASLNNLALLYHDKGDYARAEPMHREALAIRKRTLGVEHPGYASSLYNLGLLLLSTGEIEVGRSLLVQAVMRNARNISAVFAIASDRQRMVYLRSIQAAFDAFLSMIVQFFPSSAPMLRVAFDAVLQNKGLATYALALQSQLVFAGKYPDLADTLNEWQTLRAQIARRTLDGPNNSEQVAEYQSLLARWITRQERLETELAKAIPELALAHAVQGTYVQAIVDVLPDGAALVQFVRFHTYNFHAIPARGESVWNPPHYLALILRAGKPDDIHMVDLGEADHLDTMIERFRAELTGERNVVQADILETIEVLLNDPAKVLRNVLPAIAYTITRDVTGWEETIEEAAMLEAGRELRAAV